MSPATCSHHWSREGGCRTCTRPHDVAPYIDAGNHRALEPGGVYGCLCGATLRIPEETTSMGTPVVLDLDPDVRREEEP